MQNLRIWFQIRIPDTDANGSVRLRLLLARNLENSRISLHGTEWRELGYGLCPPNFRPAIHFLCRRLYVQYRAVKSFLETLITIRQNTESTD